MKVLVLGATGMIGSRIVTEALSRGHHVFAASRSAGHDERPGVERVALDVFDTEAVRRASREVDLVVSAVSPRNTKDARAEALGFTQSLIDAVGDTRLIQVGGASSLRGDDGEPLIARAPTAYRSEAEAMLAALELLERSDLDYTVLAPAQEIGPGERTGRARVGGRTLVSAADGSSRISAEDYAAVLLDEAEVPQHRRTLFNAAY